MDYVKLSKTISHALRHEPHVYNLKLDEEGWVSVSDLLKSLGNKRNEWKELTEGDLFNVIASSSKTRFEISNGKIRALYGHSVSDKIVKEPVEPPDILYHGTAKRFLPSIKEKGILSIDRQYVHLSADKETALLVGKRRDKNPVILKIRAKDAWNKGFKFYMEEDCIWLADYIEPEFIEDNK